jgi:cysteinyl-tRNA synthetase
MIVFTNTPTRRKEEFVPLNPPQVTMYTCGPTVYNYAHIGNFRANITYDIVKRWLMFRGFDVKHVMNITDVDDKTIRGSREQGLSLNKFTETFTRAFIEDCGKLNIMTPDITPRATENIPRMIQLVETLVEKGIAYAADDGSVYFSIAKFDGYGKLSNLDTRSLQHGARIDHDEYDKDHVSDFVLWKGWSASDGDVKWDSPWGPGRPGWHLECSVMSQAYLGDTIDIHMGGEDLVFPHHENEIAQSEAASGKPFVRYWLHNGYLLVEGRKMSKSLGNFYTLRDVLEKGYTGREIRFHLLSTHYRQPFNFTFDGLHAARSALQRLDDVRTALEAISAGDSRNPAREDIAAAVQAAETAWISTLDDDMNISPALGAMFDLVHQANKWLSDETVGTADAACILSFLDAADQLLAVAQEKEAFPAEAVALMKERIEARKAKNWSRADEIRDSLAARGLTIEDTASGPRLKRL